MERRSSSRTRGRAPALNSGTALDSGMRYLGMRAHSRVELRRKLGRKGFEEAEITGALERLTELGYLDDDAFARALVRRRSSSRGPSALASELAAKGVDRAGVAAALATLDVDAQLEAATRLAERLCAGRPAGGYQEMLNRVGAKLLRRGFSSTVVRAACRTVLAGTSGSPEA